MLKKIPVDALRLGMHLHGFEGNWINHPFWKTRFVLKDPRDLQKVRESGVTECWIDVALGDDVAVVDSGVRPRPPSPPAVASAAPMPPVAALSGPGTKGSGPPPPPPPPPPPLPREVTHSLDEEMAHAAAVCKKGRAAVFQMFSEARLGKALDPTACAPLVEEITGSVMRNPGALISLARLKTQDDYSYMHSVAVCALMVALARELGHDDEACRTAGMAGLLHDMGKALMPVEILQKPGKLTDAEFDVMRSHPKRGWEMLVEGGAASEGVLEVCLHHHEKMDGSGYPDRLSGEQITQLARMGAVCDVYDAVTSNRPYKAGWDPAESIAQMASWKGHFDPSTFQAFVRSVGIYPTGSIVRLQSQRVAIVVEQNPKALISPKVKAFFSLRSQMPEAPRLIDLAQRVGQDKIVAREDPQAWQAHNLHELWAGEEALKRSR